MYEAEATALNFKTTIMTQMQWRLLRLQGSDGQGRLCTEAGRDIHPNKGV